MYGILVYNFSDESTPLQHERFLLHLGKTFDTSEPVAENVISFTLNRMRSTTMEFAQNLKKKFAVDVFISLHYAEEDRESVFYSTKN